MTAGRGAVSLKHAVNRLVQVVKEPQTMVWELERLTALWMFRRRYGPVFADGIEGVDPKKTVLVVNLNHGRFKAVMSSLLAKALQLRGCRPVILTYRWCTDTRWYYEACGLTQFEFFDDWISRVPPAVVDSITQEAERYLASLLTVKAIKALEYREVNVGRPTLSSIARSLFRGRAALSQETVKTLLGQWLPLAMQRVVAAEALLDRVQPDVILFHEKGYVAEGPLFEVALKRGINTVYWCNAHRDDALMLKRYTRATRYLQPTSLSQDTWAAVRQMPWTSQHEEELAREFLNRYHDSEWFLSRRYQDGKQLKTRPEVQAQLGLDPSKRTAVVFSHMTWDASFFHGEDLFDDYEEWLVETTKAACANPSVNWIIKLHPGNVYKFRAENYRGECSERVAIQEAIGQLPGHVKLLDPDTDINTFSLFGVTDYCVTVRGTVGVEMACHGIPTFTAGTSRYSGFGFTIDSETVTDYLDKMRRIHEFPALTSEQTELAKKYAHALFIRRPARFETFTTVFRHDRPVRHPLFWDLRIAARSGRDLREAPDLKAFAEWVLESQQEDFLMPGVTREAVSVGHIVGAGT